MAAVNSESGDIARSSLRDPYAEQGVLLEPGRNSMTFLEI